MLRDPVPIAMELVAKIIAVVAVTTYMLQAGLATSGRELRAIVRRRDELARALVVMLVLGPLAARLLAALFALEPRPAVALVLLSLAGVVPLASRGASSARGDLSFALVLTAALGFLTAFTAAPTTRLVLGYEGRLEVRTGVLLVEVLLLQALPLAIGVLVRSRTERVAALERGLRVFNTLAIVAILVAAAVIVPRYGAVRSLGWNGALAACVFSVFLAGTSYLLAGPDPAERRTVAALANKPNVMLAILIVTSAGVDPGFAVAIVGVFLVRLVTGLVIQGLLRRRAPREDRPVGSPSA